MRPISPIPHIHLVDALAVGGVGIPHRQFAGVVLRLTHPLGQFLVQRLSLDHGQLAIAIDQHVIGGERLAAATVAFDAAGGDGVFAQDLAALDDTPARRFQRGINVLGPGFGFVHGLGGLDFFGRGNFCNCFAACSKSASTGRGCASANAR